MSPRLDSLPPELLLDIINHLKPSSRISLKLTSKHFQLWVPAVSETKSNDTTTCERLAKKRALQEHENMKSKKRRCVICDGLQPKDFFRDSSPICSWHDGWFMSTSPKRYFEIRNMDRLESWTPRTVVWIAVTRTFCVHNREVIGWNVPDCCCTCESCGHFEVMCYARRPSLKVIPKTWELSTDECGNLCVMEEGVFDKGPQSKYKRQVPIITWERLKEHPLP